MGGFSRDPSKNQKNRDIGKHQNSINPNKVSSREENLLCPKYVVKQVDYGSYYGSQLRLFFNKDDLFKNLQIYLESPHDLLLQPFIR